MEGLKQEKVEEGRSEAMLGVKEKERGCKSDVVVERLLNDLNGAKKKLGKDDSQLNEGH